MDSSGEGHIDVDEAEQGPVQEAEDEEEEPSFFKITKKTGKVTQHFQQGAYRYFFKFNLKKLENVSIRFGSRDKLNLRNIRL